MPERPASCVRSDELRDETLVSKLLQLQRHAEINTKSREWIQELKCLHIPQHHAPDKHLCEVNVNAMDRHDYIAVSYSQTHMPRYENGNVGSYTISPSPSGRLRRSKARDDVLARVIRYAAAIQCRQFWIDEECISNFPAEEKQTAMDSMDLVYPHSDHPLGLLALRLQTQDQINVLSKLMANSFITGARDSHPKLRDDNDQPAIERALNFLDFMSQDRWWNRAWIFQEEYLSNTYMDLLLRYSPGLTIPSDLDRFSNEIRINARKFRDSATRFLLAVLRSPRYPALHPACAHALKTFGKYALQYEFQRDWRHRAMSARIFSDIRRRDITYPYDFLPIAANTCNYAVRFDATAMQRLGYSVALCALAMYLLNGEIVRHADEVRKLPEEMPLGEYVQYISFRNFDPPVAWMGLSYLKGCRLRDVELSARGMHTRGHLWKVVDVLETAKWSAPLVKNHKRENEGLENSQRDDLGYLVYKLERTTRWDGLAREMRDYLADDLMYSGREDSVKKHKDMMANTVVEAIRLGEPLFLVGALGARHASGILVGLRNRQSMVFTSWFDGWDKDRRKRGSRVSLEVDITVKKSLPLLKTVRWVNGIVFSKQDDAEEVAFQWPEIWNTT